MNYGIFMDLQLFADGDGGEGGQNSGGNNGGGVTYSFEQAEQIANERASRAEKSALTNYFKQNGMTEEQAYEAFKDFKAKKEAGKPDVAAITKERDAARAELESYKNRSVLSGLKVDDVFTEFVEGKVSAMVTDKKDFKTAADEFIKDNPQYVKSSYRFSTGSSTDKSGNNESKSNSYINDLIRGRR